MRSTALFIALLVSVTLVGFGCTSSNNPVQNALDTGRNLAMMGPGDPGNPPPPPIGGPKPPPMFWGGCLSFYQFDYDASLPDGTTTKGPGNLTIFNKDCSTDGADVMVRFMLKHVPIDKMAMFIPGTMTLTDTGANVTGGLDIKKGDDHKGFEWAEKFSLDIAGDPSAVDNQTITGTLSVYHHMWFTMKDGTKVDKEANWTFQIDGVGAVPPPCPPPPPPGGGNPPPPPPPPGGGG